MIKPKMLKKGDTVALVSLSAGIAGEANFIHRYELGKKRLENEFGLNVITMPNALKGIKYLDEHPEARAKDLMDAFSDKSINGIITMIGGDDTVRILKYIDFDIIKNNPKIFMGMSDTTANHLMMYKAGLISFYGAAVLAEFAENVEMHEYVKYYLNKTLFEINDTLEIKSSPHWTSEYLEWAEPSNDLIQRKMTKETKGHEFLQGSGKTKGKLFGGCLDTFPMLLGTEIWPSGDEWNNIILFMETSEEFPEPHIVKHLLRGLLAQGIFDHISGIIVGKPKDEKYYEEYKIILKNIVCNEAKKPDLPIIYNMNFGHCSPICVLPYGVNAEIDCNNKTFKLLESGVVDV